LAASSCTVLIRSTKASFLVRPNHLRSDGEASALIIREPETSISDLFSKNAVFFYEVVDRVPLMLVQPARDAVMTNERGLRIPDIHESYHSLLGVIMVRRFNTFEFLDQTASLIR
jgi:hypothetical protein